MPLQPKERLGPYEILALLGVGGMGEVYRGRDTRLGRDVALKVISPQRLADPEFRRRFELEARAASVLNHPSIVTVYDVGETGGVSWIAMEWVEGRTLREALIDGALPLPQVLAISRQVAEGLAAAHAKGIVHRDLKPENVMLVDGRSKILDFGLARQTVVDSLEGGGSRIDTVVGAASEPTFEGSILGTVGYMSPEQASGRSVDFRSDQFAFGLIVYEMLAGQRAFSRPTAVETLAAIIREEPTPLPTARSDTPPALDAVIARCLAKRPEDRFASTRELVAALEFLGVGSATALTGSVPLPGRPTAPALPAVRRRTLGRPALLAGAVLALALGAAAWLRFGAGSQPIDSLAILPFVSAGGEADSEFLADGLTESLIDRLSRVSSLKVMARATVFRHKGASDAHETGRKLGVGAVLTGDVSRRGSQLSINAELIETASGARLWAEKYDRPFTDLLRVQDSIVAAVAGRIRPSLSPEEKRALARFGTENPDAYELYLKGRFFFLKDTEEGHLQARRLYREAVNKDPRFVEAHLGVGATYATTAVLGFGPPGEAWAHQAAEVEKALALDPGNVRARGAAAIRRFYFDWDWPGTEREFEELANDPRILLGDQFRPIALYFWARGRTGDAIALLERALRLDPGNLALRNMLGNYLAQAGKLDQAIRYYREAVEVEPSDPRPLFGLADALKRQGTIDEAIETRRKAYALAGEEDGETALASARTEEDYERAEAAVARFRLEELEGESQERYVSPLDVARLQAEFGDREKAFASLEAAVAERSAGLVFLNVERAWDAIRSDPRFARLVRQVGIP